ncbi:MAG: RagB/SusD family nutrient uptake outer membrane protein [Tannerella sp.]|jgi:hypothetical protein|nr:RagB/SusD family nutrient uptake outer membrane protein [Tannerella sp.]
MKTIIQSVLLTSLLLFIPSCEDFLDTRPNEYANDPQATSDTLSKYNSVADAIAELNGAYNNFKADIYQFENFFYNDVQSDNCYVGGDGFNEEEIDELAITSLNSKVRMDWNQYFSMIGTSTSVIENTRMMNTGISETEKRQIIAEAQWIRAFAYFDVIRIWGDAPIMDRLIPNITPENLDEVYPLLYPKRQPASEIYTLIRRELEEALPYLESRSNGAFRATKGAAYGLLAKIYATEGNRNARDYRKVINYCDMVIAENYQLVSNFDDMFNPANNFTSESIFEVDYTTTAGNWAYWVLFSEEDGTITWRRYCTPTHDFLAKFGAQDKRLASSVVYKSVPYDTYYPANNYPIINKIRAKESNIILMRLADILLLKAEALAELNSTREAIEIVNVIRNRAGLLPVETGKSQEETRLIVENERQLELFMEGHRWFDLLRNDRAIAVMMQHKDRNGKILFPSIPEFRMLWPVPQNEKDANPNLAQNPGY